MITHQMPPNAEFDVIVVGGGAAGCIVAGRLAAAERHLKVLLIERGEDNHNVPSVITPGLAAVHTYTPDSKTIRKYECVKSPRYNNRDMSLIVGNILGGGGSINLMGYSRPSASDFDDWKTEGWTAHDMLPMMKKCEEYQCWPDDPLHGYDGPLGVSYGGTKLNLAQEWLETAALRGIPIRKDLQDLATGFGSYHWPKWIDGKTGRRSDTAHAYIHAQQNAPNLCVLVTTHVSRVLVEGDTAVAVECVTNPEFRKDGGKPFVIRARRSIVIAAGALASPGILERSGIGSPEILKAAGVKPLVDLPGVGNNYQDHQLVHPTYATTEDQETMDDILRGDPEEMERVNALFKTGKGSLATNFADAGTKLRPNAEEIKQMGPAFQRWWKDYFANAPDKPVAFITVFGGFYGDHTTIERDRRYITTSCWLDYPASTGYVHIKSADPLALPEFDCGFLSHPSDMPIHVWTYKKSREIARRLPCFMGEVPSKHPKFPPHSNAVCKLNAIRKTAKFGFNKAGEVTEVKKPDPKQIPDIVYSVEDDQLIEDWVRTNVTNVFHSASTCAMKPRADGGVVDRFLNVYGVKGLKVADLSIMPSNVGANTFGVACAIGEKCAVIMGQELQLALGSKL